MSKVTFDGLQEKGFIRVDDSQDVQFGPDSNFSYQMLSSVRGKKPYSTLTGRQQFYIDHEWYLEVGEQLAVHKEPVAAGGSYPLRLTGGHNRWSQHSIFRANQPLLRLQRGSPVAYLSVAHY